MARDESPAARTERISNERAREIARTGMIYGAR